MSASQSPESGHKRTLRSGVRNPRRRPRQSDNDSAKAAPRRKRSKIDNETFRPPRQTDEINGSIEAASVNGDLAHTTSNGGRIRSRQGSLRLDGVTDMPLRGRKVSTKRPTRADGGTALAQNSRYSIKLLPSTPKELRREGVQYRGSIGGSHHALAVTREHALIWDYTSHTVVHNPRVFKLPFSVKASDPLPFGALVTAGSSTDFGLVLVSATSGKTVFYESVERAASLGFFQDGTSAVEGSIPSLWSGETVTDLILAEYAGFILTLSSGRIIHLTLRDASGKARIAAEALRVEQESSGGIFGSIKDYLGTGGFRKDIVSVHTRPLDSRGRVQVIALTRKAELQLWDLEWNGRPTSSSAVDFRELLVEELKKETAIELQGKAESWTTLDFAIMDKPDSMDEIATPGLEKPINMLVLARVGTADNGTYVLAEISIEGREPICTRFMEVETYNPSSQTTQQVPQLLLPTPQHTAIIYYDDALTVISLETPSIDGPDAQLRGLSDEPTNFEDTCYLSGDKGLQLLRACVEDSRHGNNQEACLAFVQSCGLVRVSVKNPGPSDTAARIPARTMVEQAVVSATSQDDHIFDFSRRNHHKYSAEEIGAAALGISGEILRSNFTTISTTPTSMEAHFSEKKHAHRALATYVRQNYPTLSKAVLWRLLWDAEKVAAGQYVWRTFEEQVAASNRKKRSATIIEEVCGLVLDQDAIASGAEAVSGRPDVSRDFFIHHLHRIEKIFPMAKEVLHSIGNDSETAPDVKMRIVEESCDLWVQGMEAVFQFRSENAATYGILADFIQDGILTDTAEYIDLPEFWTSTETMLKAVVKMTNSSRELAADLFENLQDEEMAAMLEPIIHRSGAENPRLIQLSCLIYQERINWLTSRGLPKDLELARKLQQHYEKTRHDQIRALANIAQSEAGLKIAEKYRDMDTLTEMIVAEMQFAAEELATAGDEKRGAIVRYLEGTKLRIENYFERFGDDWANAYFDVGFSNKPGLMLKDGHEAWQDSLTRYLRAEPSRAKICWINDLIAEKDFARATRSLTLAGRELEPRLWNRKVELSMAKLATLATQEELAVQGQAMPESDLQQLMPDQDLTIVEVQQQLYDHLYPEIMGLIDHQAELQEAMKRFGWKNQDLHSLRQVLAAGLDRVLSHEALPVGELIDVFTLMDVVMLDDVEENLNGSEFYLALKVLAAASSQLPQHRVETLLQLIWKRCFVYDDWVAINSAQKASDDDTAQALRQTIPWHTLYFAFDQGLLDTSSPLDSASAVRLLRPSDCLGAGCLPEDLNWRFPDDPELLDPIVHDNKVHDEQLQGLIDDRRLDAWIDMVVQDVLAALALDREEKGAEGLRQKEFDHSVSEQGKHSSESKTNGFAHGSAVGGTNGVKQEEFDGVDGVMDVEMAM